jgi:uncharacterized protein YyaL (SSP411 family)
VPFLLCAVDFSLEEPRRAVIAGETTGDDARELLRAAHLVYQPNKVMLGVAGPVEPFARTLTAKDNKPTAYVCTGTACQAPTHSGEKLQSLLR